jgi:hypothetical protein
MLIKSLFIVLSLSALLFSSTTDAADIEWNVLQTLNLKESPVDIAFSTSRNKILILTKKGELQVFDPDGQTVATLEVGKEFDQLYHIQGSDVVLLSGKNNKTAKIIELSFIEQINTAGAPFKGIENAPVVIAVFSDFE